MQKARPLCKFRKRDERAKKIAPVEMISTGATYEVVAGAGFEPATSGL